MRRRLDLLELYQREVLGYVFSNKLLLLEALTHGSVPASHAVADCYQRLEFMGDALIDLFIIR